MDTNKDGKLTADDREYCGSSDPKIIYGFNINAGWKGIDLSLMFNGAAGVKRLFDGYEVYGNFSGDAAHPATIGEMPGHPITMMPPCHVFLRYKLGQ